MPLKTKLRAEKIGVRKSWFGLGTWAIWRLTARLEYEDERYHVMVPAGFETDFASVPRLPLAYLLAGDTAHEAAVIHDYLYRTNGISRSEIDALFYTVILETGEPLWRAWLMWCGVRVGAWRTWNRYRNNDRTRDRSQESDSV